MRKIIDVILIVGFIVVDFLFFHDLFKAGEVINLPQYLTDILSVLVFVVSIQSLVKKSSVTSA